MAVLADNERLALWADLMREMSAAGEAVSITKADLRAALNAADAWADSNAASYNTAIPQPARGALTARQKARLLTYVIRRRQEVT
jgi:molybdopterin-guanine dinucleotide biosynthesis protein